MDHAAFAQPQEITSKAELQQVEKELDSAHRDLSLMARSFPAAVWHLLAYADVQFLAATFHAGTHQRTRATVDMLVNAINHPVGWLWRGTDAKGAIPAEINETILAEAEEFFRAGVAYDPFTAIYPHWYRKLIRISVCNRVFRIEHSFHDQPQYEAYTRLIQASDGLTNPPDSTDLVQRIERLVAAGHRTVAIPLDRIVVRSAFPIISALVAESYNLPENWEISTYSLGEYKDVSNAVRAIAFAWMLTKAAGVYSQNDAPATGGPLVVSYANLVSSILDATNVRKDRVHTILRDLTYGSREEINVPDPALQPLIPIGKSSLMLSLLLLLGTAAERNFVTLMNMLPDERVSYLRLVDEKEALMASRIREALGDRYRYYSGGIPGRKDLPDIDLALIHEDSESVLLLELKWFISPAEVREVHNRSKDLAKGVSQCLELIAVFEGNPEMKSTLFGVGEHAQITSAVVSANWIGFANVQHDAVPIINQGHLLERLLFDSSLSNAAEWLLKRCYLPVEGKHFSVGETSHAFLGWTVGWYGIKPLIAGSFSKFVECE